MAVASGPAPSPLLFPPLPPRSSTQNLAALSILRQAWLGNFANTTSSQVFNNTHTIFGIVIVALFLIQPILGIIHHLQYRRNLARAPVSYLHIWYGRLIILLGVINGGLGLQLADNTKNGEIAYGVVAGVVGLTYILMCIFKRKGGASAQPPWKKEGDVGLTSVGSNPPAPPQYAAGREGAQPHYS